MKLVLSIIFFTAIVSWMIFGYIIWSVPPKIDGELVLSNFLYAMFSGFLGLSSLLTIFIYFISKLFTPKRRINATDLLTKKIFLMSVRRSLLISTLFTGTISLNVFDLLNILNVSLLVGILILVEIYFTNK